MPALRCTDSLRAIWWLRLIYRLRLRLRLVVRWLARWLRIPVRLRLVTGYVTVGYLHTFPLRLYTIVTPVVDSRLPRLIYITVVELHVAVVPTRGRCYRGGCYSPPRAVGRYPFGDLITVDLYGICGRLRWWLTLPHVAHAVAGTYVAVTLRGYCCTVAVTGLLLI